MKGECPVVTESDRRTLKICGVKSIDIKGEYIKLDALLKFASIASTGGEAKVLIQSGEVFVGKELCTSRGRKIRPGTVVRSGDRVILVKQGETM